MGVEALAGAHFDVAVVGAGPAGIFAAREIALQGHHVAIFNRDIKPGGLAEYGIYPFKYKMKEGLRAQFRMVLSHPRIQYYGNVTVGGQADLSLDDLRGMGFQAILVTAGAQGTKWLGLPGEELSGVYHAKDLVYHYNSLPPYSAMDFRMGKRAVVIGVGNVMLDVAHWLLEVAGLDEIVALARRGPAEVKFDKKELEAVVHYLDMPALNQELERVRPAMLALGQDPSVLPAVIEQVRARVDPPQNPSGRHFHLEFLASPLRILGGAAGQVTGLEVEETELVLRPDGETAARGTGRTRILAADTVIFAIGDRVDSNLGLPVSGIEFVKNPAPRFPMDGISYEAFDPARGAAIEDVFVAGWSRQASTGLVGLARRDGTQGARALLAYLQTLPAPLAPANGRVSAALSRLSRPVVTQPDLARLEQAERAHAAAVGLEFFKFDNNPDMLQAMGLLQAEKT